MKITDCDKAIYLRFSYAKKKHTKESLKKLAVLEFAMSETRKELEKHLEEDKVKGNGK